MRAIQSTSFDNGWRPRLSELSLQTPLPSCDVVPNHEPLVNDDLFEGFRKGCQTTYLGGAS